MSKKIIILTISWLTLGLLYFVQGINAAPSIVINEVLPAPSSDFSRSEWVELFNVSAEPINLNLWKLAGKTLPNVIINPQEFIIITKDLVQFKQFFDPANEMTNVYEVAISLSNSGAKITLANNLAQVIDELTYGDSNNYRDRSWERISPDNVSVLPHCFASSVGKVNMNFGNASGESICPTILFSIDGEHWFEELETEKGKEIYFGLTYVEQFESISWQIDGNTFQASTPKFTFGNYISDVVVTVDVVKQSRTFGFSSNLLKLLPDLRFNEIVQQGETLAIESYSFESNVNLNDWKIIINSESFLVSDYDQPAANYTLVYLAKNLNADTLNTFVLQSPYGKEIDHITLNITGVNKSYSLKVDGNWVNDYPLSLGDINLPPAPQTLQFSEVFPNPDKEQTEWVELYNYGNETIDFAKWSIKDNTSSISLSGSVKPQEHRVIEGLSITLNNTGETLTLYYDGTKVDTVTYPTAKTGETFARKFDNVLKKYGGSLFSALATPGKLNSFTSTTQSTKPTVTTASRVNGGNIAFDNLQHFYKLPNLNLNKTIDDVTQIEIYLWQILFIFLLMTVVIFLVVNREKVINALMRD